MNKYEATLMANSNNVGSHCIWCRKPCDKTEIVNTGEAWERWCYCKECDSECFHLIKEHSDDSNENNDKVTENKNDDMRACNIFLNLGYANPCAVQDMKFIRFVGEYRKEKSSAPYIEFDGRNDVCVKHDRTRVVNYNGNEVNMNMYSCSSCRSGWVMEQFEHRFCPFCGIEYKFKSDVSI